MYYNKSSFPIYLYPLEITFFSLDKIYDKSSFIINNDNFENDFLKNIKSKEKQDLFGYLTSVLPSIIISNYRKFTRDDLKLSNIQDMNLFFEIANLRIDLKAVQGKLSELTDDKLVKNDESHKFIMELHLFIFQYVFIKLSQCIIATEINDKGFFFNIGNDSKKYIQYSRSDKKTSIDRIEAQKKFVDGYLDSFETKNNEKIKIVEQELIFMSDTVNQKKRLKSIIDEKITFSESITKKTKNKVLLYFFKEVIAKFFFKYLDDNLIDDYEVSEAFRTFRKRA